MPNAEKSISLENATDVGEGLTSKEVRLIREHS